MDDQKASSQPLSVRALLIVSRVDAQLEESLARLKAQDHPGLRATVAVPGVVVPSVTSPGVVAPVDAVPADAQAASGSEESASVSVGTSARSEIASRVNSILPEAIVCEYDPALGYGAAVNQAVAASESQDKTSLLFVCSDSITLKSDTVSGLVEQLLRLNAGVVAPKLLVWDDPLRLVSVGFSIDKTGGKIPLATPGELDQGQYDDLVETFGVRSSCMLIRTDLMVALHGFSQEITFSGEDLDFCWRANLATAQVALAHNLTVRYNDLGLESEGFAGSAGDIEPAGGGGLDRRAGSAAGGGLARQTGPAAAPPVRPPNLNFNQLRWRHRLFSLFTCSSRTGLAVAVPAVAFVSSLEAIVALVLGHPRTTRNIFLAWWWNIFRPRLILRKRRQISLIRYASDSELRHFQAQGLAELKLFWRNQRSDGSGSLAALTRGMTEWFRSTVTRSSIFIWLVFWVFLIFGSRHLISRGIPEIGQFSGFPESPGKLFSQWFSSLQGAGLGSDGFNSIALGILGILSSALLGAMGLARTLAVLLPIPLGALGIVRLLRKQGGRGVGWIGATVYLALPLPYNAIANGAWEALLFYGALPWIISVMLADPPEASAPAAAAIREKSLALGLLTAAITAFVPAALVLVVLCLAALAIGSELLGVKSARLLAVGLAGSILGFVLSLPQFASSWGSAFFRSSDLDTAPDSTFGVWELLRFATGPINDATLGWGLLLVAVLPLLVVRDVRFIWVVRGWALICLSVGLAWAGERTESVVPSPDLLLVPAGVGFSIAAAMGVAALISDLPNYRFGWRQLVPLVGVAGLIIMVVPTLTTSFNGRWNMSKHDYTTALAALSDDNYRVLWLGHPDVLPGRSHEFTDGVNYVMTSGVSTQVADFWVFDPNDSPLKEAISLVRAGASNRLGRLLAPMSIRHVVVLESRAPPPAVTLSRPAQPWVENMLKRQLDMRQVDLREGIVAYENISAQPIVLGVGSGSLASTESFSDAVFVPFINTSDGSACAGQSNLAPLGCDVDRGKSSGILPANSDVYIASGSENWDVRINARDAPRSDAFGWAQVFSGGEASETPITAEHNTPAGHQLLLALQLVLWLAALLFLLFSRQVQPRETL